MQINVNIPDASAQTVLDGVCTATGWQASSGVSQADWVQQQAANFIKGSAKRGLLILAQASTSAAVDAVGIN